MPVIKSAKKKLRQDIKREKANKSLKLKLKAAIKDAKKTKTAEKIKDAVKIVDKIAGKKIIHKNKAARIKSRLSKLSTHTKVKSIKPAVKKPIKKVKK
jgi:small subunit ribosomal protein S20